MQPAKVLANIRLRNVFFASVLVLFALCIKTYNDILSRGTRIHDRIQERQKAASTAATLARPRGAFEPTPALGPVAARATEAPASGNVADHEAVRAALRQIPASVQDSPASFALVMMLNRAFLPFTHNWLCNTRGMPGVHERTLLLFTDDSIADLSQEFHVTSVRIGYGISVSELDMEYGTYGYWRLVQRRVHLVAALVHNGIDFLLCEPDALWVQNPLDDPELLTAHDIIGYSDSGNVPGFGFLRIRATPASKRIFAELTRLFDANMRAGRGKQDTDSFLPTSEQHLLFQLVHSSLNSSMFKMLARRRYVDGRWYEKPEVRAGSAVAGGPVVINNNWIKGNAAKIRRVKKWRHWFLQDDASGRCVPPQDLEKQMHAIRAQVQGSAA